MRIHVALVGVNRSLSRTHSSIVSQLQSTALGSTSSWSLTLIQPDGGQVNNPRLEEKGWLESEIPDDLSHAEQLILSQPKLDSLGHGDVQALMELSAEWSAHPESVRNLFRFLIALKQSFETHVEPLEPDVVVFCRPDLMIHGELRLGARILALRIMGLFNKSSAILPAWGRSRGLNDRFAVLTLPAAKEYFSRVFHAREFFELNPGSNPEGLLAWTMRNTWVWNGIFTPMARVRLGYHIDASDQLLIQESSFSIRLNVYRARVRRFRRMALEGINQISRRKLQFSIDTEKN